MLKYVLSFIVNKLCLPKIMTVDHSPFGLNPHLGKKNEIFHTARKNILKLVKLPSLVAKYCKKTENIRLQSL